MISCVSTNVVGAADGAYWLDSILSGLNALAPYLLTMGKDALDAYLYPRMLELDRLVAEPPPPPPGQQDQQNDLDGQLYWLSLLPFAFPFAAPAFSRMPDLIGFMNGPGLTNPIAPCGCTIYCSCPDCQCTVLSCDECPDIPEIGE